MPHKLLRITDFKIEAPYTLRIWFDDGAEQTIDFYPILAGELCGPLRDPAMFSQVRLDAEFHTPVWPNDADFDPETPRNWPIYREAWLDLAESWKQLERDPVGNP